MRLALTTTSYALLGLMSLRPWTTYELAQQMERGLKRFWPRAQSRVYDEPKRLAAEGLSSAESRRTGRRTRTVYSITERGNSALKAWLETPGKPPVLEFEALVKIFFAEHISSEAILENVRGVGEWARAEVDANAQFARGYLDGTAPFTDRTAQIVLVGKFVADFALLTEEWAIWAQRVVEAWARTGERAADAAALADVAARSRRP